MKARYGTGTLSGFVRANGRTIGSATSGATERANADTQALFEYLWGADANLTVSGGRGASANADWAANKTIALPDLRGRVIAGLDDMGNTSAGRLSGVISGGSTSLGNVGGAQTNTVAQSNLPNISPTFTGNNGVVSVASNLSDWARGFTTVATGTNSSMSAPTTASQILSTGNFTPTGTISSINGGVTQTAMGITQPTMTMTFYLKL
jgi:microcystin-dependent protein